MPEKTWGIDLEIDHWPLPVMQRVYELILNAAAAEANVIIYGESGTGKELVAQTVHNMSERRESPFVKDIIISGGENISTVEVENTIYKHPDVLEVAVVSTPHPKWGEVPKAFVKARPGSNPTEQDIIAFCKGHMARFKAPKMIEFGDLPKTATGKIQKFKRREKEWSGYVRKVA